mmetsp:Transcript_90615/g.157028  ORF Transcript_90615/g.157028 Transcript_90615/m.157028 type:complete len:420 (-) Transcript_90615:150-1409(-)
MEFGRRASGAWARPMKRPTQTAAPVLEDVADIQPPVIPARQQSAPPVRLPKAIRLTGRPASSGVYGSKTASAMGQVISQQPPRLVAAAGPLMVSGSQTGQVVAIEATVKRVPDENNKKIADLEARIRRLTEALDREKKERIKDQAIIKKLEAKIKELKTIVQSHEATQDKEISSLTATINGLRQQLATEKEERQQQVGSLKAEVQQKQDEAEMTAARLKNMEMECKATIAERDMERAKAFAKQSELEAEIKDLLLKVAALETQLEAMKRQGQQNRANQQDLAALRRETAEQLAALQQLLREKNDRILHLERELRSLQHREAEREAQVEEYNSMKQTLHKYNVFLQKICQPQFSVVKDASLTPVNPNGFNVVEGHVLVPLKLLLEGYGMLPTDLRETYNQTDYNPPTASNTSGERRKSVR